MFYLISQYGYNIVSNRSIRINIINKHKVFRRIIYFVLFSIINRLFRISVLYIGTLLVFYIPSFQLVYYIILPFIYIYMVFKLIGFATKKIDNIRRKNVLLEEKPKQEKKVKAADLAEKMAPIVARWVEEKKFCREGLNIKDVAMEMGTNSNYLSQYLNNCLDQTFQIWLNTLRIEESKVLLTSGEKITIEEIGAKVGIPQNYNFSRWFKTITNMTPFQYRKAHSSR